jgi:FAD/FMN-containing dehydrogenase
MLSLGYIQPLIKFLISCRSKTAWGEPACIVSPNTTQGLQHVVSYLVNQSLPFAVRSGGHTTSPGAANINGGVLIALSNFRVVEYDAKNSVARIGTGLRWAEVYPELDPHNITVVGARVLGVGVGGFMLGSKVSLDHCTRLVALLTRR